MEYVVPLILVLLVIGAAITLFVVRTTAKGSDTRGTDPTADEGRDDAPGIGTDFTPLGDTSEHSGEQTADGRTVTGSGRFQRESDGAKVRHEGEGEGAETLAPLPDQKTLSDR